MAISYDEVTPEQIAAIQRQADMGWAAEVYERFCTTQLTEATRRAIMPHTWEQLPLHWRELLAFTYAASRDDWKTVERL